MQAQHLHIKKSKQIFLTEFLIEWQRKKKKKAYLKLQLETVVAQGPTRIKAP